ncbi:MAG: CocE/NonD family hydrolase, partial [Thermaurantiacus sp.]
DGPWPVLLERTPYDRRGTNHGDISRRAPTPPRARPEIAAEFAAGGYVVAIQDCRGRFDSEGAFTKYLNEGPDGADTIAWLRTQPWCDGRIATYGLSYGAHVQTALAAHAPAGLAAMFLDSGGFSSAFHSGIRQGGTFELKQLTWALKHARLAPETAADPRRRRALDAVDIRDWVSVTPWTAGNSPLAAAPEYEAYVLDLWRRETFDAFWQRPELAAELHHHRFPDVPMVHMSSWYDPYAPTAIANARGLSGRSAAVRLVLGPWTHGQRSVTHAGDVDLGPDAPLDGALAADYVELRRAFFDHHLKGTGADPLPDPVTWFRMGGGSGGRTPDGRLEHGGRWLSGRQWPPAGAVPTPFFLSHDGRLAPRPPASAGSAEWVHDPWNPVPTCGGAMASGAPLMRAGAFDQRERRDMFAHAMPGRAISEREDVLVFETEPLTMPLEVSGPLEAILHVASSAVDTDIAIKLVDVHPPSQHWPQGFAMNLAHGILRLRFREGFDAPRLLVPGDLVRVHVKGFPTSNLFLPGHRLRLEVASSNFPHFDINPGTGAPAGTPSAPVAARNRIVFSEAHPSHILLHVRQPVEM